MNSFFVAKIPFPIPMGCLSLFYYSRAGGVNHILAVQPRTPFWRCPCRASRASRIVLKQHVAPGSALAPGSQVPLIAGRYEAPAKVPNVAGMDWSQAKAHLTQVKLTANIASRSTSLKQKRNIVLEQSVRAGTEVAPGTTADLVAGWYLTPAEMAREIEDRRHQPIPPDGQK
jgi:beta-lactam-binding protein with PASTA domain